jgi:hypothetical protein
MVMGPNNRYTAILIWEDELRNTEGKRSGYIPPEVKGVQDTLGET